MSVVSLKSPNQTMVPKWVKTDSTSPKTYWDKRQDRGWHEHEELGNKKGTTPNGGPSPNTKEGVRPLGWDLENTQS